MKNGKWKPRKDVMRSEDCAQKVLAKENLQNPAIACLFPS
jgi:hypothetical protein